MASSGYPSTPQVCMPEKERRSKLGVHPVNGSDVRMVAQPQSAAEGPLNLRMLMFRKDIYYWILIICHCLRAVLYIASYAFMKWGHGARELKNLNLDEKAESMILVSGLFAFTVMSLCIVVYVTSLAFSSNDLDHYIVQCLIIIFWILPPFLFEVMTSKLREITSDEDVRNFLIPWSTALTFVSFLACCALVFVSTRWNIGGRTLDPKAALSHNANEGSAPGIRTGNYYGSRK